MRRGPKPKPGSLRQQVFRKLFVLRVGKTPILGHRIPCNRGRGAHCTIRAAVRVYCFRTGAKIATEHCGIHRQGLMVRKLGAERRFCVHTSHKSGLCPAVLTAKEVQDA